MSDGLIEPLLPLSSARRDKLESLLASTQQRRLELIDAYNIVSDDHPDGGKLISGSIKATEARIKGLQFQIESLGKD